MARAKTNQHAKIVNFLNTGKSLSISYARNKLGVTQLPARVTELRAQGFAIYTNAVSYTHLTLPTICSV